MSSALLCKYMHYTIMDYISLIILNVNIQRLLNLNFLKFQLDAYHTGEFTDKKVATLGHCKIIINDSSLVRFKGSIHQFYNSLKDISSPANRFRRFNKGFNGNQFSYEATLEAINYLECLFDSPKENMIIQSFEFGVNVPLAFSPKKYIRGLLCHRNIEFEHRYKRNYAEVAHDYFKIKIYNKGYQYGLEENLIRIELKVLKMAEVKVIGFKTLKDFSGKTYSLLLEMLLKRFNEVLYYDYSINESVLKPLHLNWLEKYKNPQYWTTELKSNHKHREKMRLVDMIQKHSNNLHQVITESIIKNNHFYKIEKKN